ncbi:MAG: ASPIC/UnbV domain-containing protein [Verrucomicrobia bacterium]|nr:ASPIC/UnbV domain-containing protein [Verrucomicrobiota bacterium]
MQPIQIVETKPKVGLRRLSAFLDWMRSVTACAWIWSTWTSANGAYPSTNVFVRVNRDGSVDSTFKPAPFTSSIAILQHLPDGRVFVADFPGGCNNDADGTAHLYNQATLLTATGSVDRQFTRVPIANRECGKFISSVALASDGKLLVAGQFATPGTNLIQLNADGTLDKIFNAHLSRAERESVSAVAVQSDGCIVIANPLGAVTSQVGHWDVDPAFTKVTVGDLVNDIGHSAGCAWGDYDNDGFLDLFVAKGAHTSENDALYRNSGNSNNWIRVKLVGTVSNRLAIGAKVRVRATIAGKTFWQLRQVTSGAGYGGGELESYFGLGNATRIETVRMEWPSGTVQEFHDLPTKQILTVAEPPRLLVQTSGGARSFSLKGGRGFEYQIEASTNLMAWSPIAALTITNLNGTAQIIDTNAPDSGRCCWESGTANSNRR